jgi:hypothetical protein
VNLNARRIRTFCWSSAAALLLVAGSAAGQGERLTIGPQTGSVTVSGDIEDQPRDYLLEARGGQTLTVSLETKSDLLHCNVMLFKERTASFVGKVLPGRTWSGTLAEDGEYIIRVIPVRDETQRDEPASYQLTAVIK